MGVSPAELLPDSLGSGKLTDRRGASATQQQQVRSQPMNVGSTPNVVGIRQSDELIEGRARALAIASLYREPASL
jgi:hypothetical protein